MRRWLALLAFACALPARAAEPLATDDASILEPGVCQLEAWHRWSDDGGHEGWGVPACSFSPHLELAIGGARYRAEGEGHGKLLLQAKTVLWRTADDRWSAGAVGSWIRDNGRRSEEGDGFHDFAGLALLSYRHPNDLVRAHANAGWVRSRNHFETYAWGTALEYDFAESWTALGEVFRDSPGRPSYQAGIRFTMVQDRVELFVSAGDRFGGDGSDWFVKFGVRLQSWKWF